MNNSMADGAVLAGAASSNGCPCRAESCWLDVGCGTGALCEVILERCVPRECVGVDVAEAQLSYAVADIKATTCASNATMHWHFRSPTMNLTPRFRLTSLTSSLNHARWRRDETGRPSIRHGRGLHMGFSGNRAVAQHIATAFAARNLSSLKRAAAAQNAGSTRLAAMEQIFRDVGLRDVATVSFDTRVRFKDFNDYWRSNADLSSSFASLFSELPAADRERFKAEVQALLPIAADGSIQYDVGTVGVKGHVPSS